MKNTNPIWPDGQMIERDDCPDSIECDVQTVCRAKDGDKDAFSLLFMKTYRQMYFVAKKILSRDEDIYDALQIGYTKAYKHLARLDPPDMFVPWLYKIIQNAAKDVRDQLHDYILTDDLHEVADRDVIPDADRRADIQDVLKRMDPHRAEVLTLYYYDGLKLSEIAKLLGEPASTVRSRFKAAKKEILTLLKTKDIDSSLYSGSISTMIALALRSVIGTDILSAVVAQQMLDGILDDGQLSKAAFRLVEQRRNKSVRHLATVMAVSCIIIAAIVAAIVTAVPHASTSTDTSTTTTTEQLAVLPDRSTVSRSTSTTTRAVMGPVLPPVWTTLPESVTTTTSTNRPTAGTTAQTTTTTKPSTNTKATTSTTRKVTAAPAGPFTPDYRVGHANTYGNSSNNLFSNDGQIAKQDQWLYYSREKVLYKVKTDGSAHQIVAEFSGAVSGINVVGDWIYLRCTGNVIARCRTDGSLKEEAEAPGWWSIQAIGDTLYGCGPRVNGIQKWKMSPDVPLTDLVTAWDSPNMIGIGSFWTNGEYLVRRAWDYDEFSSDYAIGIGPWFGVSKTYPSIKAVTTPYTPVLIDGDMVYTIDRLEEQMLRLDTTAATWAEMATEIGRCSYDANFRFVLDGILGMAGGTYGYGRPGVRSVNGDTVTNHWPTDVKVDYRNLCTFDDGYVYTFTEDGALCRAKPDGSDFERIT